MWCRNREGYADFTAGIAISDVSREERKEKNMAKRSCRRTNDEERIHEKAVKMRKMTDEQLVHYVEDRVNKAKSEGINQGKAMVPKPKTFKVGEIINKIGEVKGIGATKLVEIKAILEWYLGTENDG